MNYELEKESLRYFKNVLVLKSNNYSVTLKTKEKDRNKEPKTFVVMKSYFTSMKGR